MKEMIDQLVKQLGVNESQATGGAAILLRAARDKMGPPEFSKLLGKVNGIDNLIGKAPQSGGLGKLFGGFAAALGNSNAAIIAGILAGFTQLGLTQQHAKSFVPVMLQYLQGKAGKTAVDALEKTLRA